MVNKCCVCLGFSVESKNGLTLIVFTQDISTALIGKLCHLSRKVKMNQLRSRDSESDIKQESTCHVKHGEAMEMSDKCLSWLQQQLEASSYNTRCCYLYKNLYI